MTAKQKKTKIKNMVKGLLKESYKIQVQKIEKQFTADKYFTREQNNKF